MVDISPIILASTLASLAWVELAPRFEMMRASWGAFRWKFIRPRSHVAFSWWRRCWCGAIDSSRASLAGLLPLSISSGLLESKSHQRHRRFGMKQVVFRSTTMARIYSQGDEKIDFVGVMKLKSVMEMDQHSRNLGNDSWKHNGFRLTTSHNYRCRGIDTKGLH